MFAQLLHTLENLERCPHHGICQSLVMQGVRISRPYTESLFRGWPHYTGWVQCPIPSRDPSVGHSMYYYRQQVAKTVWEDDLREDLLRHILEIVRADAAAYGSAQSTPRWEALLNKPDVTPQEMHDFAFNLL